MDTFFLYAYEPDLFWKAAYIARCTSPGGIAGARTPDAAHMEAVARILIQDFHASYLLVRKQSTPDLYDHAMSDSRFVLRFDSPEAAIFQLPRSQSHVAVLAATARSHISGQHGCSRAVPRGRKSLPSQSDARGEETGAR